QIAQDATDVLARHPGHGSQVLPADALVEQNASATRVFADIVHEFEQRAGNTAPHRQEARGSQGLVGLSQACRQDGRELLVDLRIVFGAVLKRLPGDVAECRTAQSDGRCRPRLVIDERELADDLALSHQRDDAFFAPIRRNRDFDQALLDAIAAFAAVAGHKERFPSLGDALERAGKQLRRHPRRQAGKNHTRPLYYAHARVLIRRCVGASHEQLLATLPRPASRAAKATAASPDAATWSIAAMIGWTESVVVGSLLVG